jgi:hypothetical protein
MSMGPLPLSSLRAALVLVGWLLTWHLTVSQAYSQTWSAENFNTGSGWVQGDVVVGQNTNDPSLNRWQGNDLTVEISPGVFVGGTDVLQYVPGYTPGGSSSGNSSIVQGGAYVSTGYVPGTNNVRIWRSFAPVATGPTHTISVFAEWSLVESLDGSYPNLDTFSFDLRNVTDSASILKLQLTPGINVIPDAYTLQSIASGSPVGTLLDIPYRAIMQVQADITGDTYNLTYARLNSATRAVIQSGTLVTGGSLAAGYSAMDIGVFAVEWDLLSADPNDPGSNYILVNDVSVVPEPSTYALLALSGLAFICILRKRGKARAV